MKPSTRVTMILLAGLLGAPSVKADAVLDWNRTLAGMIADQPPPFQNRHGMAWM